MHIFSALYIFLLGITLNGMDNPITINPISSPQTYFNELDARIEREAHAVKDACAQHSLTSAVHHLQQLSAYLAQAEERHDDFSKAFEEKQLTLKRSRAEIALEPELAPDKECLSRIIEFRLQTIKFIDLFEGMSQENLTIQNWREINALFKSPVPVIKQKKTRIEESN